MINFKEFLNQFENTLGSVFKEGEDAYLTRGLPKDVLNSIMGHKPLSVAIPKEYGGRGTKVKECLAVLSSASYQSLPLSLVFGINIALFLEPFAKYAQESVKNSVFKRFLEKQNMGGLMITELDYGSDALNMQTFNQKEENLFKLNGIKHWQGLTGMADYWLITSRAKNEKGELSRDIDFFLCDANAENQKIEVEEYYNNIGLSMIPYGKNIIDIKVPESYKLIPETSGIKMMLDVLHRSRMQFPGMATGFIKRMLDEAISYCKNRIVGGKNLLSLDQVQFQISKIQSAFTLSSAMCFKSSQISGIEHNLSSEGITANVMKAYVTDLMQESSHSAMQVHGGEGYKRETIAGRGIMDSRPFQIFEGSNEMLYTQISEMVLKLMKRKKDFNIYNFFKDSALTNLSHSFFKSVTNFSVSTDLSQRKMVELGKVFSRVISLNFVLEMGEKGFRNDLVKNCIESVALEVTQILGSFNALNTNVVIENYNENKSDWFSFA